MAPFTGATGRNELRNNASKQCKVRHPSDEKLLALMAPATVLTNQAFITNHRHRRIQRRLEQVQ